MCKPARVTIPIIATTQSYQVVPQNEKKVNEIKQNFRWMYGFYATKNKNNSSKKIKRADFDFMRKF